MLRTYEWHRTQKYDATARLFYCIWYVIIEVHYDIYSMSDYEHNNWCVILISIFWADL